MKSKKIENQIKVHELSAELKIYNKKLELEARKKDETIIKIFTSLKKLYHRSFTELCYAKGIEINEKFYEFYNKTDTCTDTQPFEDFPEVDWTQFSECKRIYCSLSLFPTIFQFLFTKKSFEKFKNIYNSSSSNEILRNMLLLTFISNPFLKRWLHVTFGLPIIYYIYSQNKDIEKLKNDIKYKLSINESPLDLSFIGISTILKYIINYVIRNDSSFGLKFFSIIPYYIVLKEGDLSSIKTVLEKIENEQTYKFKEFSIESTKINVYSLLDIVYKETNLETSSPSFVVEYPGVEFNPQTIDGNKYPLARLMELCDPFPYYNLEKIDLDVLIRDSIDISNCDEKRFEIKNLFQKIKSDNMNFEIPKISKESLKEEERIYKSLQEQNRCLVNILKYSDESFCFMIWNKANIKVDKSDNMDFEIPSSAEIVKNPKTLGETYDKIKKKLRIRMDGSYVIALMRVAAQNLSLNSFNESEKSCGKIDKLLHIMFESSDLSKESDYLGQRFNCDFIPTDPRFDSAKARLRTAFSASDPFLSIHLFFKCLNEINNVEKPIVSLINKDHKWKEKMARLIIATNPEKPYTFFGYISTFLRQFKKHLNNVKPLCDELDNFDEFSKFFFQQLLGDFITTFKLITTPIEKQEQN